jgi:hypothetical protein
MGLDGVNFPLRMMKFPNYIEMGERRWKCGDGSILHVCDGEKCEKRGKIMDPVIVGNCKVSKRE